MIKKRFTFNKNQLIKNAEQLNGKRDMRKKFIKSDTPTYKKIKKAQEGLKFVEYKPSPVKIINPEIFNDFIIPSIPYRQYSFEENQKTDQLETNPLKSENLQEDFLAISTDKEKPIIVENLSDKEIAFNKAYDNVEKRNPEAKKYRKFLTQMADQESKFNVSIQNLAGAPAYGYFQFMEDGKKYHNISKFANVSIEEFRNNPELQIEAAIRLAKAFEKGFNEEDLKLAKEQGISKWGLLGGAWLAGNGGVRKYLKGQGNLSDRHWSKTGQGTDVASRIKAFNYKKGGQISFLQNGGYSRIDWDALQIDPEYRKNFNWRMNKNNLRIIEDSLINRKMGYAQRIGVLSQVVPENGGESTPHSNGAFGLVGWRGDRAIGLPKTLSGQIHWLMEDIHNNKKAKNWTDGGSGTNVDSGKEMLQFYMTTPNVRQATKAFMKGYVRPPKKDYEKRIQFTDLLKRYMK